MNPRLRSLVIAGSIAAALSSHAFGSYHLMQIEQIIGGVNGDASKQAIQLRMCAPGQNLVSFTLVRAWDANGENPVIVLDIPSDVTTLDGGSRILIASENFVGDTNPVAKPDFTLTNPIPASYLGAGSLTFESQFDEIVWRVSWGGEKYSGSCQGDLINDVDGNFCPAYPGSLPNLGVQALKFQGAVNALSTNNQADYSLTGGAAIFTNNAGVNFTIVGQALGACCLKEGCNDGVSSAECDSLGGAWQGASSTCAGGCAPATGACCLPEEGVCKEFTEEDCLSIKGTFQGVNTTCESVSCTVPCVPDIAPEGGNGVVDVDDLLEVINHWGACKSCHADITQNGEVDVDDLLAVINAWGPCQ